VIEKIKLADELDVVFGRMLRMDLSFGLRRMEVLQMKPHKSDMGSKLRVYEAKNGRQRDIEIETAEQRQVLDAVKASIKGKLDHLGWKQTARGKVATLEYNLQRYNKSMAAIGITRKDAGVTGHGLRAQFAENAALIAHMIPPTLGGTGGQMQKDELDVTRAQVSELLGHSRVSITGSYYGSFGRNVTPDAADRCKTNIERALRYCHIGVTKTVTEERLADCLQMVKELTAIDVDITARQVQMLWEIHSERFAVYWKAPQVGNAEALEAAALRLIKQEGEGRKHG
jgi:integrase